MSAVSPRQVAARIASCQCGGRWLCGQTALAVAQPQPPQQLAVTQQTQPRQHQQQAQISWKQCRRTKMGVVESRHKYHGNNAAAQRWGWWRRRGTVG